MSKAIAAKFAANAFQYDQFARVQKLAAKRLADQIAKNSSLASPKRILEIGCGTGILSKYIISQFPNCEIELLDPAHQMLMLCAKSLNELSTLTNECNKYLFIEKTIENYLSENDFHNRYSIIASSFTLHWIANLPEIMRKLVDSLDIGGQFYFTYPINRSFPEWKSICKELHIPFTGNDLPGTEQLKSFANPDRAKIVWQEICFKLSFSDAFHFFKEMKSLGAATALSHTHQLDLEKTPLSITQFRNLISRWNQSSSKLAEEKRYKQERDSYNQSVNCTYWLVEGIITRHS